MHVSILGPILSNTFINDSISWTENVKIHNFVFRSMNNLIFDLSASKAATNSFRSSEIIVNPEKQKDLNQSQLQKTKVQTINSKYCNKKSWVISE